MARLPPSGSTSMSSHAGRSDIDDATRHHDWNIPLVDWNNSGSTPSTNFVEPLSDSSSSERAAPLSWSDRQVQSSSVGSAFRISQHRTASVGISREFPPGTGHNDRQPRSLDPSTSTRSTIFPGDDNGTLGHLPKPNVAVSGRNRSSTSTEATSRWTDSLRMQTVLPSPRIIESFEMSCEAVRSSRNASADYYDAPGMTSQSNKVHSSGGHNSNTLTYEDGRCEAVADINRNSTMSEPEDDGRTHCSNVDNKHSNTFDHEPMLFSPSTVSVVGKRKFSDDPTSLTCSDLSTTTKTTTTTLPWQTNGNQRVCHVITSPMQMAEDCPSTIDERSTSRLSCPNLRYASTDSPPFVETAVMTSRNAAVVDAMPPGNRRFGSRPTAFGVDIGRLVLGNSTAVDREYAECDCWLTEGGVLTSDERGGTVWNGCSGLDGDPEQYAAVYETHCCCDSQNATYATTNPHGASDHAAMSYCASLMPAQPGRVHRTYGTIYPAPDVIVGGPSYTGCGDYSVEQDDPLQCVQSAACSLSSTYACYQTANDHPRGEYSGGGGGGGGGRCSKNKEICKDAATTRLHGGLVAGVCKPILATRHHKVSDCQLSKSLSGQRGTQTPPSGRRRRRSPPPSAHHHHHPQQQQQQLLSLFDNNSSSTPSWFINDRTTRCLLSAVVGLLIGASTLLYVAWRLQYGVAMSLAIAASLAFVVTVAGASSRYVRCHGALLLPTVGSSACGRLALLITAAGIVVGGPVANVCRNVRTMSVGLACGLELGRNQSALIASLGAQMPPSSAVAVVTSDARVDDDIVGKSGPSIWDSATGDTDKEQKQQQQQHRQQQQQATDGLQKTMRAAWWRNLRPLEDGLMRLNGALYNGVIQLYGAHKACKTYVERAYGACVSNIQRARTRCFGVMDALGNVYSHARDVLDRLNPDRWAPRVPSGPGGVPTGGAASNAHGNAHVQRRQTGDRVKSEDTNNDQSQVSVWNEEDVDDVINADQDTGSDDGVFDNSDDELRSKAVGMVDDRDICDPLHSLMVCRALNASETLCAPSGWAGDAIRVALNTTQSAFDTLIESLELRLLQHQQHQRTGSSPSLATSATRVPDNTAADRSPMSGRPSSGDTPLRHRLMDHRGSEAGGGPAYSGPSRMAHDRGTTTATSTNSPRRAVRELIVAEVASVLDVVESFVTITSRVLVVVSAVLIVGATNVSFQTQLRRAIDRRLNASSTADYASRSISTPDSASRAALVDRFLTSPTDADHRPTNETMPCISPDGDTKTRTRVRMSSERSTVCEKYQSRSARALVDKSNTTVDSLFVVILHAVFAAVCYAFDVAFVWILQLVRRHSLAASSAVPSLVNLADGPNPGVYPSTSGRSVSGVDETVLSVLDDLLAGVHAEKWLGFGRPGGAAGLSGVRRSTLYVCLVDSRSTDLIGFAAVVFIHVFLVATIFARLSMSDWSSRIVEFFYPEKRSGRPHDHAFHGIPTPPPPSRPAPQTYASFDGRLTSAAALPASHVDQMSTCFGDVTVTMTSGDEVFSGAGTSTESPSMSVCQTTVGAIEKLRSLSGTSSGGPHVAVRVPRRCVVCGQTVSRRRKQVQLTPAGTTEVIDDFEADVDCDDDQAGCQRVQGAGRVTDVCPVCDSRFSPLAEGTLRQQSEDATPTENSSLCRLPADYYRLTTAPDL